MDQALEALRADVVTCEALDNTMRGRPEAGSTRGRGSKPLRKKELVVQRRETAAVLSDCLEACKQSRKRHVEEQGEGEDLSDEALSQYTRFTDQFSLQVYQQFLHYVPRLVNVLAEALPMPGSGLTLPLNLCNIAARCKGSYYAPRRFAAVQLAYSTPRCRVLVFHTGRLVGTGTQGAAAARLAIARAQLQLAKEAGVHINVRNFQVINQVGAVSLHATLNCDAFASAHSAESHFDKSSFVGLAWRPPKESICCEIYSTGRANLPGSVTERQMLDSFSRMMPELLRFSSASHLLDIIPQELQDAHHARPQMDEAASLAPLRPATTTIGRARQHLVHKAEPPQKVVNIWDGWGDADETPTQDDSGEQSDLDLEALGL